MNHKQDPCSGTISETHETEAWADSKPVERFCRLKQFYGAELRVFSSLRDLEQYLDRNLSAEGVITQAYQMILRREPEPGGYETALSLLRSRGLRAMLLSLYCSEENLRNKGFPGHSIRSRLAWKFRQRFLAAVLRFKLASLCRI
ncbi:MAG: hypothetical protein H6618_02035 [Deltaproteobacteria bacterium]|nr:hypothetical protein [Deltaproteobacteria bacterium]